MYKLCRAAKWPDNAAGFAQHHLGQYLRPSGCEEDGDAGQETRISGSATKVYEKDQENISEERGEGESVLESFVS
jgi:hypothetical protein